MNPLYVIASALHMRLAGVMAGYSVVLIQDDPPLQRLRPAEVVEGKQNHRPGAYVVCLDCGRRFTYGNEELSRAVVSTRTSK